MTCAVTVSHSRAVRRTPGRPYSGCPGTHTRGKPVNIEWNDAQIAAEALTNAKRGDAESQCYVAVGLTHGSDSFPQNKREALTWLRRAAAQLNPQALYNLGYLYEYGDGVPADPVEAERLYRLAAAQGHPEAREALGLSRRS